MDTRKIGIECNKNFEPILILEVKLPLEACSDLVATVGREEAIQILGTEFVNSLEKFRIVG